MLRRPWPAMLRGIYKDDERYRETYWSKYEDIYFAGDGARDRRGRRLLAAGPRGRRDERVRPPDLDDRGRVSALVDHQGWPRPRSRPGRTQRTGQAIVAFVSLKGGDEGSVEMLEELADHVAQKIGPIAKPANIVFTPELPKTR